MSFNEWLVQQALVSYTRCRKAEVRGSKKARRKAYRPKASRHEAEYA